MSSDIKTKRFMPEFVHVDSTDPRIVSHYYVYNCLSKDEDAPKLVYVPTEDKCYWKGRGLAIEFADDIPPPSENEATLMRALLDAFIGSKGEKLL